MKCPRCTNKHPYSSGMTCSRCGYAFRLDPKLDKMADGKFLAIVRKVSANDSEFFTTNQFHAERCRRDFVPAWYSYIGFAVAAGFLTLGAAAGFADGGLVLIGIGGLAGLIAAVSLLRHLTFRGHPLQSSQLLIKKFHVKDKSEENSREPLERLLTTPELNEPPPQWKEPDIYDYGVERILIVQRDLLVDLFVRNEFHSAQRALVVSVSGYPSYLAPVAAKLAQQREDLPIFVLHDASESGQQTAARAAKLLDVPQQRIKDLGIDSQACKQMKSLRRLGLMGKPSPSKTVPIDYLTYGRISEVAAACFVGDLVFHEVVAQQVAEASGTFSFG